MRLTSNEALGVQNQGLFYYFWGTALSLNRNQCRLDPKDRRSEGAAD